MEARYRVAMVKHVSPADGDRKARKTKLVTIILEGTWDEMVQEVGALHNLDAIDAGISLNGALSRGSDTIYWGRDSVTTVSIQRISDGVCAHCGGRIAVADLDTHYLECPCINA